VKKEVLMIGLALLASAGAAGTAPAETKGDQRTEPVVVTATRTPQALSGVAGSLEVVTAESLAATAAPDVKAALSLVPSLLLQDSGSPGGVATISLRGSTAGQVLILLDGRRLANAQSGWYSINDLPVPIDRIERIEILPTSASALYGADALGGVVNVITKPVTKVPGLMLAQGGGSDNEWRTAAGAQLGLGNLGVRFDGELHTGDGFRDNGDFETRTIDGTARLNPNPWGINLEWQYLDREAGVPGSEAFPTPAARQEDTKSFVRVDFTYLPKTGWDVKGGISANQHELGYRDPGVASDDPAAPPPLPIASDHDNTTRSVDLQWDYDTGGRDIFTLGGEWVLEDIESSNDGTHDMEHWGVFAQEQWRSGGWMWTAVLREDHHSVYGSETNPSTTLAWQSGGGARFWIGTARGFRAPTFDDLYWSDPYTQGNPDLKPESSWNYEYGMEKRWQGAGLVRLNIFQRRVENLIQWVDTDGDFVYRPENVNTARVRGAEVEVEYRPTATFVIPIGYQYLDTEDLDTGDPLPGAVRSLWRMAAQYTGASYAWSLEGAYTDRGDYQYKSGSWDYLVINAALSWRGKVGTFPLKVSVRADNLQGKDYQTLEGYPMPGRTFYAEVGFGL
jgi:outer membrane receptor for ferrienterochelin and colicins